MAVSNIPDMASRKTRRRIQAIAKRYEFQEKAKKCDTK